MSTRFPKRLPALLATFALACVTEPKTPDTPDQPTTTTPAKPSPEATVKLPFDPADANAKFTAKLEIRAYQRPLAGATVAFAGQTYTSDANGLVTIENVPLKDTPAGQVTMAGFMPRSFGLAYATAGAKALRVFLFPEGTRANVSASAGGSVAHGPGKVTLVANSVVDAAGVPYTGEISVTMRGSAIADFVSPDATSGLTLADKAEADMLQAGFSFVEGNDGALAPMLPVASVQVELTDAAGGPLQLREGATASLTFLLENGNAFPDGSEAETVVFDEARQVWTPAGTCTVKVADGKTTCEGTVSHFSTYAIRWQQGNVIDGRTTDFVRCGVFVPTLVTDEGSPARVTQVIPYVRLSGIEVPIQDVSNDGRIFISPSTDVVAEVRLRRQDAAGNDVGEELSYRVDKGDLIAKAMKRTWQRVFTKAMADSLKTTPTPQFAGCPRIHLPILVSAAAAPAAPCDGKCNAETEICVAKEGTCIPKVGTCTPACGAHATCVGGAACVCESGYYMTAEGTCAACSSCEPGQYASAACTPLRDTACAQCAPIDGCNTTSCTSADETTCLECNPGFTIEAGLCIAEPCLANQHVSNNTCVACEAGTTRPAGDDPSGPDTSCAGATTTELSLATASGGTDVMSYGGDVVRGFEFGLEAPLSITSINVTGLPPEKAGTAKLWIKSGAIELQTTEVYELGPSRSPTTSTTSAATFAFTTPLVLAAGTHSLVLSVADTDAGLEWGLREFPNTGQFLTSGSLTIGPIWGWYGMLDATNDRATSVSGYDSATFQVPRFALTVVP